MPDGRTTAWEGHGVMAGVDTRTHPSQLGDQFASSAVNRTFRGGRNDTRPVIQSKTLLFETPEDEFEFKKGNVAGAYGYQKSLRYTQPHLIVAAGSKILKGRMFGDTIEFSTLYDLRTPEYMHAWFVQGEDRLYYQNGVDDPVGWDGANPAYDIVGGLSDDKMPIGTIMAYIHGRLVVFTADNHAIVSDYIYGNGVNTTAGLESFIEAQQFNDIGALPTPASMGSITGAIDIPRTPNRNAQGDLLVLTKNGAYTLRLTGLREEWLYGDIMQIVLKGVGGASPYSVVAANNDIWFRTGAGDMSTYKFERSEMDRTWGDTSLSREVSRYFHVDTHRNLQFCSSILAHNRLITSCAIGERSNEVDGYGRHRFGEGMVVLDFDKGSTVNQKPGFAWDGLWTGINPVQFVSLTVDSEIRPLAISHDEDGENRIYEFMPDDYTGSDMAEGKSRSIVSFYETPHLFDQRDPNGKVIGKRLVGGRAEVSDVDRLATIKFSQRPNHYPCWSQFSNALNVGSEPQSTDAPSDAKKYYDILRWGNSISDDCEFASTRRLDRASFFQARVEITGNMVVDQLQYLAEVHHEDSEPTCADEDRERRSKQRIDCIEPNLFEYKIVTRE